MVQTHIPGFPRIGAQRELKFAQEAFWRGEIDAATFRERSVQVLSQQWQWQHDAGLDWVTVGDGAWYDPTLTLCATLGALPSRFGFDAQQLTLAQYFELARGNTQQPAMEMTKWFDTNYHHLVPEVNEHTRFDGGVSWWLDEVDAALAQGHRVKPVLLGPVSFLHLCRVHGAGEGFDRLSLLPALVQAYQRLLKQLADRGVTWCQVDEPILCTDLDANWQAAFEQAWATLPHQGVNLLLAACLGPVDHQWPWLARVPAQGLHVDLVRGDTQWGRCLADWPADRVLSVGVVDGRNVWRTDLRQRLGTLHDLQAQWPGELWVSASCSLQHVPVSLASEQRLDPEVRGWLAFAREKLDEVVVLAKGLTHGALAIDEALRRSDQAVVSRRHSGRVRHPVVQRRLGALTAPVFERASPFPVRIQAQQALLKLPLLPTTTIGSFPQTSDIRRQRAAHRRGDISALTYLQRMRDEVETVVRHQEALGLDVLVHGEPERNDMVEYFAEHLWGFAFTDLGWVQSYGSRCVKPPILYGDVFRPEPITVETTRHAQSLTDRWMKGMLTGPITMLQWSFVRDDQPRSVTALQLALAIRDEVQDLEHAGIRIIQIDEPAFREGLPLRQCQWPTYLDAAVKAFKLSASVVKDDTQIHTHMCYSEFNDILPAIAAMDADVITIETSRSAMALLDGFGDFKYPNDIGPGVYDIHSPRVPSVDAMVRLLERASEVVPVERLWVNPDCGLKTRAWPETLAALANMVAAASALRLRHQGVEDVAA